MTNSTLIAHVDTTKITRDALMHLPIPESTRTFKPVPHAEIVNALIETLNFRHIGVVRDEYSASKDGMKMFGVMDLETQFNGCRFSLGLRNSNDKSMRLALTVGYRVFVCDNLSFQGDFTPVLATHSKNFNLLDTLAIGIDRVQRNFKPIVDQVEFWKNAQLTAEQAKLVIYEAFIAGDLDVPRHLARDVHSLYFNPTLTDFAPRTFWSLSNAFTSALKQVDGNSFYKATAKLGTYLADTEQRLITSGV